MGKREFENAWEGFDGQETVYNEKEEKAYEGTIWKYLLGVAVVVICIVIFRHVQEIQIYYNGTCIEAEYFVNGNGSEVAKYYDSNNKIYMYDISGMNATNNGETVKLYYIDDIYDAVPMTSWTEWALYYVFFGVMLLISGWRLMKVYKK